MLTERTSDGLAPCATSDTETERHSTDPPVIARTKFAKPRLRDGLVHRSELVDVLLTSSCRLAVVTGAAGMGKSTLMAQTHDAAACPVWLSIDQADDDPVVLWWGLIACLGERFDGFGSSYRDRLTSSGAGVVDDVVGLVVNELAEIGEPVHLFVDDVHVIQDSVCRRTLHRFVRRLPEGCRVTVASRASPPLPLARFRVEQDLLELDGSDLAMSVDEASRLFESGHLELSDPIIEQVTARTEGWPAGLQLAAMALAETGSPDSLMADFRGTDRLVNEYLTTEVMDALSTEERRFLITTAPLRRLCGDLCDAVTGSTGSAEVLDEIVRCSGFVVPADRTGTWFRHHRLFGELLASESRRTDQDETREVHLAAFDWLRSRHHLTEALDHGMAAGQARAAADMVAEHWFGLVGTGQLETLLALLDRFEDQVISAHQPLAIAAAVAHGLAGNHNRARRHLAAAEQATYAGRPPDGATTMSVSLAVARSWLALDGVNRALANAHHALDAEPLGSPWRPLASLLIGRAEMIRGDPATALPYLDVALESADGAVSAYGLAMQGLAAHWHGDGDLALRHATEAIERFAAQGLQDTVGAASAYGVKARIDVARGNRVEALDAVAAGTRPMARGGRAMPIDTMQAALLLAEAALDLDEPVLALDHLNRAARLAADVGDTGAMGTWLGRLHKRWQQLKSAEPACDFSSEPLTTRELEVLALLPDGLTIAQIAEELFLSKNTIKTYVRRLYRKLGASSRGDAVALGRQLGLVDQAHGR